jgi:uncharacterized protein (DUF736 family)
LALIGRRTGALFKNDRKESENHPDYKGSINIGGREYWLSGWAKTSKDGARYLSLAVRSKEQAKATAAPQQSYASRRDDSIF